MSAIGHNTYEGIILGHEIRASIAKTVTYRVRRGNGVAGSILGHIYQDKYDYFQPPLQTDETYIAMQDILKAGLLIWQGYTEDQKKPWRDLTRGKATGSGYNIFMGYYLRTNAP